tara:strand:- start:1160 stop:1855 length:696 start_codon:yes stop_codon:yes gene_type:complete
MMGAGGITNVGPINTPTTGKGAIAGFDPIMGLSKRRTKARKKKEAAGKQWEHRRDDPTYIDGRSKQARKLIKRLTKRKKKMAEALQVEDTQSGGETTKQAYKFISQKRKVQKKQEREKRAANRKKEIETISRAKASDYAKKGKDRQKKLSQQLKKEHTMLDGLVYLESLCELVDGANDTTFYFRDETELVLTKEEATVIIERFSQLSEEHQEKLTEMLSTSKEIITTFMSM